MTDAVARAWPLLGGLALGLQFGPVSSVAGSSIAAALSGYAAAPRRRVAASAAVVLIAWLIGDGRHLFRALATHARPALVEPVAAAVVSLGIGYVLPAAVGAYVGRHVHRGRGWPSAIAVAATLSLALSTISAWAGDALVHVVPGA